MTVYDTQTRTECILPRNTAMALGNFDGVHLGHVKLFDALGDDLERAVFTFFDLYRVPGSVLCDIDERIKLMGQHGIRYICLVSFSEVKDMTPSEFADHLVCSLGIARAVCGFNFTFGKGRSGDAGMLSRLLSEKGVQCITVPPVLHSGERVSSTRIRSLLSEGDTEGARELLGRYYSVVYPVIHGREIGRTIGFPTVNQVFPENHVIPKFGVYAVYATVGGKVYPGVCNIGIRPTFELSDTTVVSETHIIGFSGIIYGEFVRLDFVKFLRPEMKFRSVEELRAQISKDEAICMKILGEEA